MSSKRGHRSTKPPSAEAKRPATNHEPFSRRGVSGFPETRKPMLPVAVVIGSPSW